MLILLVLVFVGDDRVFDAAGDAFDHAGMIPVEQFAFGFRRDGEVHREVGGGKGKPSKLVHQGAQLAVRHEEPARFQTERHSFKGRLDLDVAPDLQIEFSRGEMREGILQLETQAFRSPIWVLRRRALPFSAGAGGVPLPLVSGSSGIVFMRA
jgi:hypothetical protein